MSESAPPPYGGPPPGPYVAGPYGAPPEHPQATTVLVLGILGLVLCQVLSPFAWVMGNRVVQEIDASRGQVGGRSSANIGRICGIVGSVMLIASAALLVLFVALAVAGLASFAGLAAFGT